MDKLTRGKIESLEEKILSPLAMKSKYSQGRNYPEKEHSYRSVYQRDRDRIIHSTAFRHLEYKTQVFVYHEGDYYRTRLTHTLEVAQIARTISKILCLNEDLTEAIALAHDLGHTPFGHAVEEVLNELMKEVGGFNHNVQGLRVVDFLEQRYPNFKGLNLSFETREGIIMHNPQRGKMCCDSLEFSQYAQPTLEAQVIDIADEIAYDSHDLDDGIKSGMIKEEELRKVPLWNVTYKKVKEEYSNLNKELRVCLIIRSLINFQVTNLIDSTRKNIKSLKMISVKDVRSCKKRAVAFGQTLNQLREELRGFLFKNLYSHWRVLRMSDKAKRFVKSLFYVYLNNPALFPSVFKKNVRKGKDTKRTICDYIAGMTDRYALEEYKKFFDPYEKV
ncbi:MAG: deoxyguanosinetriphosphate triphosphohydrolase [Candidatus Omnitrophica bacterium]|nr:deoxyguanosinetriphosphate triphosphohydrolase [Candidatus Omnitrophota bacterium]MBU0896344.1 deoxyguanosinetriphosphate triphosphohydrolase [Candidatus Omnitrophota bacterium]MBU1133310.1 deoxyguanosinetriphosphate triphosphohydrolase [Candidatus Omnitrophota bacterium]MBU1366315.1 deoxyguanosinetriphosphate triphosphohydrolase [Candidatus Omnitrophota bacterium]MBU1523356.1 deoxyguanosinetriphosphate triphosphohydrolase [Candidatus Omnitrophota bacterium]